MIGRQGKDDLSRVGDEVTARLLGLDGAEKTEQVDQHDAVSEFRLVVETVNLTTVLWDGGERKDVVQVETEGGEDVVDESLDILLRALVERDDGEGGAARAEALEDPLVVLEGGTAVAGGGDDDAGTTGEETLQDLDTDRTLADTGEEGVLVLECRTGVGDFVENVEVHTCEIAGVLPQGTDLALHVEERDLSAETELIPETCGRRN